MIHGLYCVLPECAKYDEVRTTGRGLQSGESSPLARYACINALASANACRFTTVRMPAIIATRVELAGVIGY